MSISLSFPDQVSISEYLMESFSIDRVELDKIEAAKKKIKGIQYISQIVAARIQNKEYESCSIMTAEIDRDLLSVRSDPNNMNRFSQNDELDELDKLKKHFVKQLISRYGKYPDKETLFNERLWNFYCKT